MTPDSDKKHSFKAHQWISLGLALVCLSTLIIEFFTHRHSVFEFESTFGFYALFGFAAYVVIVRLAMGLRRLIKRSEDYYD